MTGPYGNFHLRRSERPILMVAGGSGMAPVLGVLRQLAGERCERPVRFYYGAREQRDLFAAQEIAALGEQLADFRYTPVTGRFVHEAIDEELTDPDVYMCGPPPMLDAVHAVVTGRGVDEDRIFQDRFTTSADAPAESEGGAERADLRARLQLVCAGRAAGDPVRGRDRRHPALGPPASDARVAAVLRGWSRDLE